MSIFTEELRLCPDFHAFSGASWEQIEHAEQVLGVKFPDEYRIYLTTLGAASINGHEFTGICKSPRLNVVDVTMSERVRHPITPEKWYVVEQTNIDDIVIWQSEKGEIWQTAPNFPYKKICGSLREYLEL